jgi:hypothetical protein
MRQFMGDGHEAGRRRMVAVEGQLVSLFARWRRPGTDAPDPTSLSIASIEFDEVDAPLA